MSNVFVCLEEGEGGGGGEVHTPNTIHSDDPELKLTLKTTSFKKVIYMQSTLESLCLTFKCFEADQDFQLASSCLGNQEK